MNVLQELEIWYQSQCNDKWEHAHGVEIGTLDNPGWELRVNLNETNLANRTFNEINELQHDDEWMKCWVENKQFRAVCGPKRLEGVLRVFLDWAKEESSGRTRPMIVSE
jgi:hypothetical protein